MASKLAEQEKIAAIQARARQVATDACDALDVIVEQQQNYSTEARAAALSAALMSIVDSWRAEAISLEGVTTRGTKPRQEALISAAGLLAAVAIDVAKAGDRDDAPAPTLPIVTPYVHSSADVTTVVELPGPDIPGSFGPGDMPIESMQALNSPPYMGSDAMAIQPDGSGGAVLVDAMGDTQARFKAETLAFIGEGIPAAPQIMPAQREATSYVTTSLTEPGAPMQPQPVFLDPAPRKVPGADVKRLTFSEVADLWNQVPASTNMSYSKITSGEDCGVKALLGRAANRNLVSKAQTQWANVGGSAFHLAAQIYETSPDRGQLATNYRQLWQTCFASTIADTERETGTSPADWRVANKGLENYDWWRVQGEQMVQLYVAHHNDARRALTQVVQLAPAADGRPAPALELPFSLDVAGVRVDGFIDKVEIELSNHALAIVDYKSGRGENDTFQLALYVHYISQAWGVPIEQISAAHWLARKGIYEQYTNLHEIHPWDEIVYRTHAQQSRENARIAAPRVSSFCHGCEHKFTCPAGPRS